jgi:ribosomal protein S18 acetylase RimI-like enzyme
VIEIRATGPDDAAAIWQVLRAVIEPGDTFPFEPDASRQEVLATWFSPGAHSYVAEEEGQVVGSYFIRPNQPGLGAHVANGSYAVHPSFRRRGVGRAMAEHSFAEARALGFRALQFNLVVSTNESAIALWRSLGFETVGRLPGAFHQPGRGYADALVMFRTL